VVNGQGFTGTSKPRGLGNQGVSEVDAIAAPIDSEGAVAGFGVLDDNLLRTASGEPNPKPTSSKRESPAMVNARVPCV